MIPFLILVAACLLAPRMFASARLHDAALEEPDDTDYDELADMADTRNADDGDDFRKERA